MNSGTRHSALGTRLVAAVREAAAGRLIVALDFDGTLVPIARHHRTATLRPATRELLRRVAERYPTVVLTGRSRKDAAGRLRGIRLAHIVGNHGLESGARATGAKACVRRWMTVLPRRLPATAGLTVENKGETLAIHFRGVRRPAATRRRILSAVATLSPRPRVVGGKSLLNVMPDFGVHKGTALAGLMRRHRARAIYVGDDLTDEDVFAMPASTGIVTVRVGKSRQTRARHRLPAQRDIDALLALLADARPVGLQGA